MKVLVISDTHGNIENAKYILEQKLGKSIQVLLHCGDYISDARLLQKFYPELEVIGVYGNCDVGFGGAYSEVITLEGVTIYMSHGHKYGVKWGEYEEVAIDAYAHEAQVALCGHSHEAYLQYQDQVLIMNPGSLSLPRDSKYPSYGILELEQGKIVGASVVQLIDGQCKVHSVGCNFRLKKN